MFSFDCNCPSPATPAQKKKNLLVLLLHLFGAVWFIFHWVQFIWKLDADKVRSIDCLIYSHRVCTLWAVKLQNSNQGNIESLKTFREHICLQSVPAPLFPLSFMLFVVVHVCTEMCVLCVGFCFVQGNLPARTHTQTSVGHPWPCGKMLHKERGWHIAWLRITSDSNHTWPRSTTPIILWICYGVLRLTVCSGFIIMTSVPHKGSANLARGLDGKQTKLPCEAAGRQCIMAKVKKPIIFKKHEDVHPPTPCHGHFQTRVFLFVDGALESSHSRVSHHLSVRQLEQFSLLWPGLIRALRWQYDHFISVDHCFFTSESMDCNGPPAAPLLPSSVSDFHSSWRQSRRLHSPLYW